MRLAVLAVLAFIGTAQAAPLSEQEAAAVAEQVSADLQKIYPFPDIGARYAGALSAKAKSGAYKGLEECALAQKMTADLQSVHPDGHLHILCSPELQQFSKQWLQPPTENNWTPVFDGVELDHDQPVALLRSSRGWQLNDQAFEQAAHALGMAAHARYVIIDLRNNPGGHGEIGHFIASYFFPAGKEAVLLERGLTRDPKQVWQAYSLPYVPGPRLDNAKLFILVNHATASAAEGFSFFMQHQKRATVIGQTTAGAGNPATVVPLPSGMGLMAPFKRVVSPDSDEGWDMVGVVPDVATEPGKEQETAIRLIREDLTGSKHVPEQNPQEPGH
ncbi:MAG TPA: S41 family peptidase [Magnetospirillaceae bacterium]|nr:S41 family peptidase [Magnetospirillaceae bacterium]